MSSYWKKMKAFRKKLKKVQERAIPKGVPTKFEEQVKKARKISEEAKKKLKEKETKALVTPTGYRISKAKTIKGLIADMMKPLEKRAYPPKEVTDALARKMKYKRKEVTPEEGMLWNLLLKDPVSKEYLESIWEKI